MEATQPQPHDSGQPPAGPLPIPPDFPVTWADPDDARNFWMRDRMHFPHQLSPLAGSFLRVFIETGFGYAFARYDIPAQNRLQLFNGYAYMAAVPDERPPAELMAMGQRSEEKLRAVVGRLGAAWREEWLPAVRQHLDAWARFDLAGATPAALRDELDATMARQRDLARLHFQIVIPMTLAMSLFQDLYRDLFEDDDPFNAHRLLQGLGNETVRANRDLWLLSRKALEAPAVARTIAERPSGEVLGALAGLPEAGPFLAALQGYLDEHGRRGSDFFDIDRPSWREDPAPVINTLKGFLANPDFDLLAQEGRLAAEREELTATARERLQGYPAPVRGQFEGMLRAAQEGALLSEDHGYYIDWQGSYWIRRVLVECGRRLAESGVIAARDDVFALTYEELRDALAALPSGDLRPLAAARQAEQARFRDVVPPPFLGTPPQGAPPDNPGTLANERFFGAPPPVAEEPGLVRGHAGSPGRARGRAVLIRSLEESARLRAGDILVAETTAPPWTPLFATAAAVVTDTGGILSHSAVVAREYRIPAVVGAGLATAMIPDGATIEVDGDAGTVRVVG